MSSLRDALMKLASDVPETRPHLLPLLKEAGEDWSVTTKVKQLIPLVIREIENMGGSAHILPQGRNRLYAEIPLPTTPKYPDGGVLPVRIVFYEGSWSHNLIVNAEFLRQPLPTAKGNPLPVLAPTPDGAIPFNARAVLKALYKGFRWLLSAKNLNQFILEDEDPEAIVASKKASGWEIAIAMPAGRGATGQLAKILDSTRYEDIGTQWGIDRPVQHGVPFLAKYTPEDQFLNVIPLEKVRP